METRSSFGERTARRSIGEICRQYAHAPLFMDRLEAIDAARKNQKTPEGRKVLLAAERQILFMRIQALDSIDVKNTELVKSALPVIQKMAAVVEYNGSGESVLIIGVDKNPADLPCLPKAWKAGATQFRVQP